MPTTTDAEQWLARLFDDESCAECGGDAEHHDALENAPMAGAFFARCRFPRNEDGKLHPRVAATGIAKELNPSQQERWVEFAARGVFYGPNAGGTLRAFERFRLIERTGTGWAMRDWTPTDLGDAVTAELENATR